MTKYSVRKTRGRRVQTFKMDNGQSYTFFEGQWLRFDTGAHPEQADHIAFFKSDDLFEVVDGWDVRNDEPVIEEEAPEIQKPKTKGKK